MTTASEADDVFEPLSDAQTALSSREFEGTNVCRASALSSLLQEATAAMRGLSEELLSLGFSEAIIEQAGRAWREFDAFDGETNLAFSPDDDLDELRIRHWIELIATGNPRSAVSFLIAMLGSGLERESAAAAAALWRGLSPQNGQWPPPGPPRWRIFDRLLLNFDDVLSDDLWGPWFGWQDQGLPIIDSDPPQEVVQWDADLWRIIFLRLISRLRRDRYFDSFLVSVLVRGRLDIATRSPDPITRSLAFAAFVPVETSDGPVPQPPTLPTTPVGTLAASTMIHGTWGWKGEWWRPGGAFHHFILGTYRPNLFNRGAKYSWSGAYSDGQRALAARDFVEWAGDVSPLGLQTVFGHSYGGEVASRAVNAGCCIQQLVLLSTPVTPHVELASRTGAEVIDVRLRFDPVLAIAGTPQRISPTGTVREVLLRRWRLDHGATHEEDVWRDEDVAARGHL